MTKFLLCLLLMPAFLPAESKDPIKAKYAEMVNKIIDKAMKDTIGHSRLQYMCDMFGPRLSGSENLEKAIDWIEGEMSRDGLENVKKDPVYVPNWKRNSENMKLVYPRHAHLEMLSLGGSIATPEGGIKEEVFVVKDKDDLFNNKEKAKGKIVLFNVPFTNYGQTVQYRTQGAQWAAQCGAVASIIRSVSPVGMNNPHTGVMYYSDTIPKIPHMAVTAEAAELLARYQASGVTPVVHVKTECATLPDALSANVMGEYSGSAQPDKYIALGGHIDSWDTGSGAQDDGAGCLVGWHAVKLLKDLGLQPKHTVRAVMWTNEENGTAGGKNYALVNKDKPHIMALESDSGIFKPEAIGITGSPEMLELCRRFEPLLKMVRPEIVIREGGGGVDIGPIVRDQKIPAMSLDCDDEGKYFWYHHSPADTPDKVNIADFNQSVATLAITIYMFSELYEEK